ncbi:Smg-4/UPF3 family-domain-containing protein [Rostrohypoxylon terebratum]|nr:Smg-4/UPF3 family-domain-containing protein [Rostrohypoxylon terebratum]
MTTTRKANGVLPVSSTLATNDAPKTKAKEPARGKKVIIRRLPPGITEAEFWAILGDEWKSGNGKVDWTKFHDGQVSQDPSNPSYPARCYLQVLRTDDIPVLAEIVQRSIWEDDKRTFNDPALVGPPYLELSIYQKVPTTKRRTDSKQGTIDQDPDFMAFLDSLTQDPAVKEAEAEQVAEESPRESVKVTTTPLVEFIKEKKANKGKETTSTKSSKHGRHESQGKTKGSQEDSKKKTKESKTEKSEKAAEKDERKPKEPVKLLTKKATAQESAEATKSTPTSATASKAIEEAAPKSRRANIAAAAKILQRDLGLSPGSAHRRARQDAAKAEAAAKTDTGKEKDSKDTASTTPMKPSQSTSSAPPSAPTAPKAQTAEGSRRSRGAKAAKQNASGDTPKGKENTSSATKSVPVTTPVILKRKDDIPPTVTASAASAATASATSAPPTGPKAAAGKSSTPKPASSQKKGSGQPSVTAGATRAFVKHANPSQGVTEPLLKQAMEVYGSVTFVEIDKRKGFAYVDFGDHEALVKAITASPVSVAQGTVQVLERKEIKKPVQPSTQLAADKTNSDAPPDRPKRGGRGRGRRGGGNANATSNVSGEASSSAVPNAAATNSKDSGAAAPPG